MKRLTRSNSSNRSSRSNRMGTKTTMHWYAQTILTRESYTNRLFWNQFFGSSSDNLKSAIENLKWMGIFALVITFAMGGVETRAQQTKKVPRIGFLGNSTAALEANLVGPFRD